MATRQYPQTWSTGEAPRALNQVQSVLRMLIWVGTFIIMCILLGAIGLVVMLVGNLIAEGAGVFCTGFWGLVAFVLALAIPSMISRCLYIIPEYERVVVLKMGEFIGVRGPGRFWVIPYPPYYQSAALTLDMRIQTQVIKAAETLTNVTEGGKVSVRITLST